jgi:hypothetical protein
MAVGFNKKQCAEIMRISASIPTADVFNDPQAAARDYSEKLTRLLYGHSFISVRSSRNYHDRETWDGAVLILAGGLPIPLRDEVFRKMWRSYPPKKTSWLGSLKTALKKMAGGGI